MLGQKVSWIIRSNDFLYFDAAVSNSLLYPERVRAQVSQLPKPLSGAHANSCTAIGPYSQRKFQSKVLQESLETEGPVRRLGQLDWSRLHRS